MCFTVAAMAATAEQSWQDRIANEEIMKRAGMHDTVTNTENSQMRQAGHVLGMPEKKTGPQV